MWAGHGCVPLIAERVAMRLGSRAIAHASQAGGRAVFRLYVGRHTFVCAAHGCVALIAEPVAMRLDSRAIADASQAGARAVFRLYVGTHSLFVPLTVASRS